MRKSVDFCDEAGDRLADGDRTEAVAIHLREALVAALREIAWPVSPDLLAWHDQAVAARLAAARMAATVKHPRRLFGVNVALIYRNALRELDREHQLAEPNSPEGQPPQLVPETCKLTLRQLLDTTAGDLSEILTHTYRQRGESLCYNAES